MIKKVIVVVFLVLFIPIASSLAEEFNGDGSYTVSVGDTITIDNGWKLNVTGIFMGPNNEQLNFKIYDPEGNVYPSVYYGERLYKYEGEKKFGTSTKLKVKVEILGVSGESYPTDSPLAGRYENAEITISSIDETLPSVVIDETPTEIKDIDKELTYSDGRGVSLKVGENITLDNGYTIKLDSILTMFDMEPVLNIYDENDIFIDQLTPAKFSKEKEIQGSDVGVFVGAYFHVTDFGEDFVDLWIVDASYIIFGTGWNLFSIPLDDGDGYGTVIESVCNNGTVWSWSNELDDYQKVGVLEEGLRIPSGKGLWVKINTNHDCKILVSGDKPVSLNGTELKAGWNLIGSPINSHGRRSLAINGDHIKMYFDDIIGDCQLDKGPWQYLATMRVKEGHTRSFGQNHNTNRFSAPPHNRLILTRGYFIKVVDDCTLSQWW